MGVGRGEQMLLDAGWKREGTYWRHPKEDGLFTWYESLLKIDERDIEVRLERAGWKVEGTHWVNPKHPGKQFMWQAAIDQMNKDSELKGGDNEIECEIKDGLRVWATGAKRSVKTPEQGSYELLPLFAIQQLAVHMAPTNPAVKVGHRNWENGIPMSSWFDSAMRHLSMWAMGVEDEQDHLRAAAWNIMCALDTRERIKQNILPEGLDDLPYPLAGREKDVE